MAGTANPQLLAAALQAGVDPKQVQRIAAQQAMLAQVLQQIGQTSSNIRTPAALGLNLLAQAVAQGGKLRADQRMAGVQQQIVKSLYPNDPRAQRLALMDPDGMSKAEIARFYTPIDVRQGNTVLNAPQANAPGGNFTAPIYHDDNGVFSAQGPAGVQVQTVQVPQAAPVASPSAPGIQRPMNATELTNQQNAQSAAVHAAVAQAAQRETERHNPVMEDIARQEIPFKLMQAQAAQTGAGAAVSNANVNASQSPMIAPPAGYVLDKR